MDGRSAPLGGPADRALFHALRARTDAVLVGAGTVRDERYGPLIKSAPVREARRREGLEEQPLALIATSSLELDPALPLLDDPASRVVILTRSPASSRRARRALSTCAAPISPTASRWRASASAWRSCCARAGRRSPAPSPRPA